MNSFNLRLHIPVKRLHRKDTKDLWNTQIADIREDIGYCFYSLTQL